MITDDELAMLIICACSSRNLLIKHHLSLSCMPSFDNEIHNTEFLRKNKTFNLAI